MKFKIPVKNGPNEERLATFLRVVLCKLPFCILSGTYFRLAPNLENRKLKDLS